MSHTKNNIISNKTGLRKGKKFPQSGDTMSITPYGPWNDDRSQRNEENDISATFMIMHFYGQEN
jgi:hypothetical protein